MLLVGPKINVKKKGLRRHFNVFSGRNQVISKKKKGYRRNFNGFSGGNHAISKKKGVHRNFVGFPGQN